MNPERFSKSDRRLTLAVVVLIALCAVYVRAQYDRAFPQASLKLVLSKSEVTAVAARFLETRGLKTSGFRQLTVFDPDDDARLYLEREVGLERANQLMERDLPVWRWRARWYRPPEQEEMLVSVSPDGRIGGFEHVVPEAQAGARLSRDQAFQLAQDFVRSRTNTSARLVEDRLEQRPNRYDYLFTWEQEGFKAKDATYRRTVVVKGDRIGSYREFLYIPEGWRREFSAMRSKNETLASIAEAVWLPLALAAVFLLVRGLRRRQIPWRPVLAISGAVGALVIASQLNMIPLMVDAFPTSSPYAQTLLLVVLESLGAGVGVFFYVVIAAAAGEPLYRSRTGDPLSLRGMFTPGGLGSRRFYRGVLAGYGFAAVHIAFLVAFYLVGRRFGVWSPQDVQYSNLLSTALPWISPVAIASMAATSEEFWFRLLAIPLLQQLLRFRWIAVVIPAFVWGFLHANYPQQPAYIRGVEVGLIGVAAGFLMLRFGIVATLVWHFAVDAALMGGFLFDSPSWYFRLNGGLVALTILAPLIVSVVLYRRNQGFVAIEDTLVPEPQTVTAEAPAQEVVEAVRPRWNPRWLYGAALVAGIAGLMVTPRTFGDWIRVRLTARQAEAIARRNVPDVARWRSSTDFNANLDVAEFEYLRRQVGADAASRIVRERKLSAVWRTRFFQPLVKEEWRVYVDQSGAVARRDHLLDERAPGDRLTPEQAQRRAETALPWSGMSLVESNEERRENRTDWSLVFEDPQFRVGEARARVSVELHGGEISNVRRFLKLPEEWVRDFQKPALRNFVIPALIGSLGMPLLVLLVRRLASHETVFHWRAYSLVGLGALVVSVISMANQSVVAMTGYDTSTPEQNYLTQYIIGRTVLVILAGAGAFAAVLAMDVFRQAALGRASLNRPSLARAAAVAVLVAGASRSMQALADAVPGPHPSVRLWNLPGLDHWLPGWGALAQGYLAGVFGVSMAGILAFAVIRYMRPPRRWMTAALAVTAVAISQSLTVPQFAAQAAVAAVWIGLAVLIAMTCSADLIGLGVAFFWLAALGRAVQLIRQPSPFLEWNGVAAALIACTAYAIVKFGNRLSPN